MLETAAILCFLIGLAHSYLGEKYILIPLFRSDHIPVLFGNNLFTKRTLRGTWHITTLAWWGFGSVLWAVNASPQNFTQTVLYIIGSVFFITGTVALVYSKGRHLSWIIFYAISGICLFTALSV